MSYETSNVVEAVINLVGKIRKDAGYFHDAPAPSFRLVLPGSSEASPRGPVLCVPLEGMDESMETDDMISFDFEQPIYVFTEKSQDRGDFRTSASFDLCRWFDDLLRAFTPEEEDESLELPIPGAVVTVEPVGKAMRGEPVQVWPAHLRFLVRIKVQTTRAALGPQGT